MLIPRSEHSLDMIMTRAHINCKICNEMNIGEYITLLFIINISGSLNRHSENIVFNKVNFITNYKDLYWLYSRISLCSSLYGFLPITTPSSYTIVLSSPSSNYHHNHPTKNFLDILIYCCGFT